MAEKKVTGPASYFPSIEKKYGKPIEYWIKELKKVSKLAHMEQVAHLKEKFEMGHGHANAIVAVFRQKNGLEGVSLVANSYCEYSKNCVISRERWIGSNRDLVNHQVPFAFHHLHSYPHKP